ncbi:PAC2 family protein [Corynebacterium aquilae]|uniref:Proteasome protein n=1 Tax=Corynebacterium aquilae DSM 44791 TaxID=1431546 RepID=A0A1L7CGA7_9CORY|nr:PAC2 family protein [Corynebacterium aquilae]APT84901.1 hypothetical protein CAQU_07310 [Corynebacterium aquilae DSM 44791]
MSDSSRRMYELAFPRPAVDDQGEGPVLVVALQGYADAGNSIRISNSHLLQALENATIASFTMDELIDYRARRPATTLKDNQVVDVESLELTLRVVKDLSNRPFLLLSGVEPDFRWDAFTDAVSGFVDNYGVSSVLFLYGAAMNVPHTRPLVVSAHGNAPELWANAISLDAQMTIPGSAQLTLEHALMQQGTPVCGFTAHVPHYLGAGDYPAAALGLLTAVSESGDLDLPLKVLQQDASRAQEQINRELGDHVELTPIISQLEQAFDDEVSRRKNQAEIARAEENIPTADELGDLAESFLASVDIDDVSFPPPPEDSDEDTRE